MKGFLIGVTIFAGFVYGFMQIYEYFADKGACSFGFTSVEYRHKERLDNTLKGLIEDIIKRDKNARKELLTRQGKSEVNINQTIEALEPQYIKEIEKIVKYCNIDTKVFQKQIIKYNKFTKAKEKYEQVSVYATPSRYCKLSNMNDYDDNGYTGFGVKYKFDKESLEFFNLEKIVGIKYYTAYSACDTKYQGLGETGHFLVR